MPTTRRLAAILAADVAGYSRLMGADEEGTHERLKAHFGELVDPKIEEHRGRTVKNTGDGLLAEFPSVVDAVRCAVEVQRGMIGREPEVTEERRIRFRIGVNLGDVIVEEHDIFGDGVNIAARLEGLAEPGGICISRMVRDQIRDKLLYPFEDRGEQSVKNIARPVRVYALRPEVIADLPAPSVRLILPISQPAVAPRLSIVVLPFANRGGDPAQDYVADVITDELTTALSRIPGSFVIARSTAFTYKGKPVDVKKICEDLGVRYVLEGSAQQSGDRVRVNAQLISAESGAHLWADQFDTERADLLRMQDVIVTRLARAVGWKMAAEEVSRAVHGRAANPTAQDLSLRAYATMLRPGLPEKERDAGYSLCEEALHIDPGNLIALIILSMKFSHRVLLGVSSDREADIQRADELASAALQIHPDAAYGQGAKGDVLLAQARYREAIDAYSRCLLRNPSQVSAYNGLATAHCLLGEPELAIAEIAKAVQLSPLDPWSANFYATNALAYGVLQDYEQALVWARKARATVPRDHQFPLFLGLLALAGHEAEARETMRRYLAGNPPIRTIAQWQRGRMPSDAPRLLLFRQNYIAGLRKAGMPEE